MFELFWCSKWLRWGADQLYVIDLLLSKLLEGSSGRLLQRECQALKGLLLTIHAVLYCHLQGAASTHLIF